MVAYARYSFWLRKKHIQTIGFISTMVLMFGRIFDDPSTTPPFEQNCLTSFRLKSREDQLKQTHP